MGTAADRVYLIWSLTSSGLGTTISGSGNSGGYSTANPNARTAVDFRFGWADDLWLSVSATGGAGTTLKVYLAAYDAQGNLLGGGTGIGSAPMVAQIGTAPLSAVVFGGRHGGAGGSYFVLPEWGQVFWTIATGSMTGVEISLYGR